MKVRIQNTTVTKKNSINLFFSWNFQCIAIVVMFALASANAGLVSYAGHPYAGYPYAANLAVPAISQYSHVDYSGLPVATSYSAQYSPAAVHYATPYAAYPAAQHIATPWAYSAPAVYAAPATILAKAPATYTAVTKGSIHTAPLEGHELSQTSLNVAPAPGTSDSETIAVATSYAAQPAVVASPWTYSAPAVYAAPATILAKAPATYTAQTRGSIHTAPLEGHELSQTSLNVAPAPGTW
jgi:Cuticle protein